MVVELSWCPIRRPGRGWVTRVQAWPPNCRGVLSLWRGEWVRERSVASRSKSRDSGRGGPSNSSKSTSWESAFPSTPPIRSSILNAVYSHPERLFRRSSGVAVGAPLR